MTTAWPDNKRFAFSVFDDTDFATTENVGEVYRFLADLSFRTTKSVWMFSGTEPGNCPGQTCEDPAYLQWVLSLKEQGFEIGYHMATWHTSARDRTIEALDRFEKLFGAPPKIGANHSDCRENIYWGAARIGGANRLLYNLATLFRYASRYRGHLEDDPLFWGDVCKKRITYWRNLVFADIDTLAACPMMPYADPDRPYVNFWFASSDGSRIELFNRCLSEENQDRLIQAGGACIMYTHFASGFQSGRTLNPRFRQLMERLAKAGGWYVPVSTLLDHLRARNGDHVISPSERSVLERKWVIEKLWRGRT